MGIQLRAAIAALLGVLAATPSQAGMGVLVTSQYAPGEVALLAQRGMPTVIVGRVGAAGAEDVIALLRMPGWVPASSFVATPPTHTGTRLVILLNPADPVAAKRGVCCDPAALSFEGQSTRLVIRAALCDGERILTRVTANETPVSGADDPRLAWILSQVLALAFPQSTRFEIDAPGL